MDLSISGSFGLNDESCSSDATVPVQGLDQRLDQRPEQGLGSTVVDDDDIRIASEVSDLLAADMVDSPHDVDDDDAVAAAAATMMEVEVFDFLNTSNNDPSTMPSTGSDISPSSPSTMGRDILCADPSHTGSFCPDEQGCSVEGTGSTCVDTAAMAVAITNNEESGVPSSSLSEPYLAYVPADASTSLLATASVSSAVVTTASTNTSEMSAEVLVPSAELLAAARAPSCLIAAAALMVDASSGKGSGDVQSVGLFANPCLDASAVGFAIALLSLLSAHGTVSDNGNNTCSSTYPDGMELVHGLAPWLWSLLPLLRSSPADDEEDDQMDCNDPQTSHQATTTAYSDMVDTTATASSSSGIGAGKRKGKQKVATAAAGKEKAGKKSQKVNHKEQEQEGNSARPRELRRVQFCFVDGSSVQPPVSATSMQSITLCYTTHSPLRHSHVPQGKDCFCGPALRTARRLMSLIDRVDALVQGLSLQPPGQGLAAALRACQMLAHGPSSSSLATALTATFALGSSPCPRAGDIAAIARLLASELATGLSLISTADASVSAVSSTLPKLSGARTVLRHRAAWMATAVLRAQLRWLLDPPQSISVAAATLSSPSSSDYHITVSNSDNHLVPASSGARSRHWCDLHRFVLLKEAIPLPVYIPPPGNTSTLLLKTSNV